jgi:hypothetical protein
MIMDGPEGKTFLAQLSLQLLPKRFKFETFLTWKPWTELFKAVFRKRGESESGEDMSQKVWEKEEGGRCFLSKEREEEEVQ